MSSFYLIILIAAFLFAKGLSATQHVRCATVTWNRVLMLFLVKRGSSPSRFIFHQGTDPWSWFHGGHHKSPDIYPLLDLLVREFSRWDILRCMLRFEPIKTISVAVVTLENRSSPFIFLLSCRAEERHPAQPWLAWTGFRFLVSIRITVWGAKPVMMVYFWGVRPSGCFLDNPRGNR